MKMTKWNLLILYQMKCVGIGANRRFDCVIRFYIKDMRMLFVNY